ncbi:MAG: tetratricopeptide repeat protein [Candidatus Hodarchaeales archaeon]|jgi:tetratricopeptide (TPR) repeat protein
MASFSAPSDLHEKIQLLIKQYQEDPGSSVILRELGGAYWELGQFPTAMFYLEQALSVNPQEWEAHVLLGQIHGDMEEYDESLSHYSRAYELSGQLDLLSLVGEALFFLNQLDLAEKHLRSTIKLEGSHQRGFSHFILGKVLCSLERYDEAFEEFRAAEKYKKTDETSKWLSLAQTKMDQE